MTVEPTNDGVQAVSRETRERLDLFEALVKKWNPVINLVSKDSLDHIRQRHIQDSVQVFNLIRLDGQTWTDLGSGGGFPGLVVAILAAEFSPQSVINLVEADSRKATFLREALRQLDVDATVINGRIESVPPLSSDIVSARALGSLTKLCGFAVRHLKESGTALFPKGENFRAEIDEARKDWQFDLTTHASRTHVGAAVLELRNIRNV